MAQTAKKAFDRLLHSMAATLEPLGFERSGLLFRRVYGANAALIEFQSSDRSSTERMVFTLNLGILCGSLLTDIRPLEKCETMDAQLRRRIGHLLPEAHDKWWEVTGSTDIAPLAHELSADLIHRAIPYLEKYADTEALIELWKSGQSPGLT